jgi:hypothetical protein
MKLIQQMPGGSNIKAFTRIMHRTADDDLVGEVSPAAAAAVLQVACRTPVLNSDAVVGQASGRDRTV